MQKYTGKDLKDFTNSVLKKNYKERFLLKDIHQYIITPDTNKTLCLYGLRRTGKTTMLCQEIQNQNDYDHVLFLDCESTDTLNDVKNALLEYPDCQYIYIDEITKTPNFINACSFLANHYAASGKKVILSGTDSLGFLLAKYDELLDRTELLHTTYISYKEHHYLLDKDLMSYIRYGGTLTNGHVFYNKDELQEYTNSAIVYNIIHSLEKWNRGVNQSLRILEPIVERNELPSFISKVLEWPDRQFVAKIINQAFKSHDLGSLQDLMTRHGIDTEELEKEDLHERIRIFLGIREEHFNHADEECVKLLTEYLQDLDVLYKIPDTEDYIFCQPGMRYAQSVAIADALVTSDVFSKYSKADRRLILQKLKQDICGNLLEDILFYQLSKIPNMSYYPKGNLYISKHRNRLGQEIDITITDLDSLTTTAIEVKLSEVQDEFQTKHLRNEEFCHEVEEELGSHIINKLVVYQGKSENVNGILYLNAEEFLLYLEEWVPKLLQLSISSPEELKKQKSALKK